MGEPVRLQKALANAGVASRRVCENIISSGRIRVNGTVETQLGTKIDPDVDTVHVDGKRVFFDTDRVTFLVNKPVGVVSTMSDPEGKPCLGDLANVIGRRVFHVGRLDEMTSGLILMSNDGELANRIMHPSYELRKVYLATVEGRFSGKDARLLLDGIQLDDGFVRADRVTVLETYQGKTLVEIHVHVGKNRIVRRMFAATGHPVLALARTRLGPLALGDLEVGEYRQLELEEVQALYETLGL